jgi:hypothetical protein
MKGSNDDWRYPHEPDAAFLRRAALGGWRPRRHHQHRSGYCRRPRNACGRIDHRQPAPTLFRRLALRESLQYATDLTVIVCLAVGDDSRSRSGLGGGSAFGSVMETLALTRHENCESASQPAATVKGRSCAESGARTKDISGRIKTFME